MRQPRPSAWTIPWSWAHFPSRITACTSAAAPAFIAAVWARSRSFPTIVSSGSSLLDLQLQLRHQISHERKVSSGDGMCGEVGGPGGVFLVAGAVAETAVEDADEAVAEGPESLVVGGAAGGLPVVGGAGTR